MKVASLLACADCQRFGRSRPVATNGLLEFTDRAGRQAPWTKALTGQRTPKKPTRCRVLVLTLYARQLGRLAQDVQQQLKQYADPGLVL